MVDPLRQVGSKVTRQSEPVPGRNDMVTNNAGGVGFGLDDWAQLRRFLILGTVGGTYYVSQRSLTLKNIDVVQRLAASDGVVLVNTLVDISEAGRAPKVQPTLYALAIASASPDLQTRRAAYAAIPRICRTGTHLYTFAQYCSQNRGWSRGLRNAVGGWYTSPPVDRVAYQGVKYRQREGWMARDLLRLAHPKTTEADRKVLFDWLCGLKASDKSPRKGVDVDISDYPSLHIVEGFERIQRTTDAKDAAQLVAEYKLPWEAVPDQFLTNAQVWDAILDAGIGITALIRNLARLTGLGVIAPLSQRTTWVNTKITDQDLLIKGRVHPIQILDALLTYQSGHGARGHNTWEPVPAVIAALDDAFYKAFKAVVPADKRTLLALDVSGSMTMGRVAGSVTLTPRTASAAMALVTAATEPTYSMFGFSHEFVPINISAGQRLDDAIATVSDLPFGGTDCALPMVYAMERGLEVDTFIVYTDSETWFGKIHPFQALEQYRLASNIDAKLVVVGLTATDITIADPADVGMLDIAGFDSAAPGVINDFSAGRI